MPTKYRPLLQRLHLITGSCFLLAAPLALDACQKASPAIGEGISDSTFVAVVAALRLAVMPGGVAATRDSAGQAAARDSILAKYKVTPAALESTASQLADRPKHAADIFGAIDHKVMTASVPAVPRPAAPVAQPAVAGQPAVTPGRAQPGQIITPSHPASARPAAQPPAPVVAPPSGRTPFTTPAGTTNTASPPPGTTTPISPPPDSIQTPTPAQNPGGRKPASSP